MAEEDEIDIIGDFSFNSCFAQNNQGIPSCSDREDTVHPQWFLDSTANNWYDEDKRNNRRKEGSSRKLSGYNSKNKHDNTIQTVWSTSEKELLIKEMSRHGRDIDKISKSLKTKSKAEIQALIEAEHGITLEVLPQGLCKPEDIDNVPTVIQEEIITDVGIPIINMSDSIGMVTTGAPTIPILNRSKISKLSNSIENLETGLMVNPSEILYEDDLIVASTELITAEKVNVINKVNKRERGKLEKKMGNHRRKGQSDKANVKWNGKELVKSPRRIRKYSNVTEDNAKSAKMHLVFSSGQALPVSEGEEVIKIEKKKECDGESDIEVDIDSDQEDRTKLKADVEHSNVELGKDEKKVETVRKFEPMPKRSKKINLGGGGGYTIMHTAAGDMYEVREEPRKEKPPKKAAIQLYPCRIYNADKPPPFEVSMCVSCLVCMDAHAHSSRAEVAGLVGGAWRAPQLRLRTYARVRAAARTTHCDIDPVSQAAAAERLRGEGLAVVGWHHSHPTFAAAPSGTDLRSQAALQALPGAAPIVALLTSQHWRVGRAASVYRCFRVEADEWAEPEVPAGYGLRVRLEPDVSPTTLPALLRELRVLLHAALDDELRVNVARDVCPHAQRTYLNKLISSVSHHMRSAGYADGDPLVEQLVTGIRDIFR